MVHLFLQQVSSIMKTYCRSLYRLLLSIALAATAPFAAAQQQDTDLKSLTAYSAQYKTTARGMALKLSRQLKHAADGSYTLTNGGKIMVVGFHEVSVFDVEDTHVAPKSYVYQGTGLINRRREVHFTPGSDVIRSLYKDQWYELPYTEGTLDRMSQQEQLRLLLLNDPTPAEDVELRVADGKRIKDYLLSFVGKEQTETPLGTLDTLHFRRLHKDPSRKSDLWVAPELDYLIVKTVHVEDDKPIEMILTSATIEGQQAAP